jgi:ribonuclease R
MGANSGTIIALGQRVTVKLIEAAPVTGGLTVELIKLEERAMPRGPIRGRGKPPKRKLGAARKKAAKVARKVKRSRN